MFKIAKKGKVTVETKIKPRGQAPTITRMKATTPPIETENETLALVGAEHGVTRSSEFQTVATKVWISLPCKPNKAECEAAMAKCWGFIDAALAAREPIAKETLAELVRERLGQ